MPAGEFISFPINSVVVDRPSRQRRELRGINELADSITRLGLIHPLVIDRAGLLISGERRLIACRQLGWTHIPVQFTDEIDPKQLLLIELEENIKRSDISWQEQSEAIARYHELRTATESGWTKADTVRALGRAISSVHEHIRIAEEVRAGNASVIAAPKFSVARGIVARADARQTNAEIAGLMAAEPSPTPIICADFREWAPTYSGPLFNFIHCDFPYGIGADKIQQGSAVLKHGGYVDTAENYFTLLRTLLDNIDRLAAPSCHIMFWFSMTHYAQTVAVLNEAFDVNPFPLIWHKTDNAGVLPDVNRGFRRVYETALHAMRGNRPIVQAVGNAFGAPTVRESHMSVKPLPVLGHFFRAFVDSSTRLLDPTCGSGTALRAALGAQHVLGLEINSDFACHAQNLYQSAVNRAESDTRRFRNEREM